MKRTLSPKTLVTALVGAALMVTFTTGCSLSDKTDQALNDARAARDKAQKELTDARQQIDDLQTQVKDLKRQLADARATVSPSSAPTVAPGAAYTPPAGSDQRSAILDSVREKIKWKKLFVVQALKVQNGWAYAELEQTDPADPDQKYESFAAVCRQTGGVWACLEALGGSDAVDIEDTSGKSLKEWLRDKYPAAPASIFK